MNNLQRKRLEEVLEILNEIIEEENEKLERMEDRNLAETEQYEKMDEEKGTLETVRDEIEQLV